MVRKHKKHKIMLFTILAFVLVAGGLAYAFRGNIASLGYDWLVADHVEDNFKDSYKPLGNRPEAPKTDFDKPFSMLLLGVDARGKEQGRSDTIVYMVARPEDGKLLMVSIPRDTYTEIVGTGHNDKINHAYAFGGAEMSVDSMEKLLGTRVDHYATINFEGFKDVVDEMGGISLPIEKDIVNKGAGHEKFTIKGNQSSYNGTDALNFVRYREDAGGDIARTERQRQFLEAMLDKVSSLSMWTKIPDVLNIVGNNFTTDLQPSEINSLAKKYLQSGYAIMSHTLEGEGKRMGPQGVWYYVPDPDDVRKTQQLITKWLDSEANV